MPCFLSAARLASATRRLARPFALAALLLGLAARPARAQQHPRLCVTSVDAQSIRVRIDNATRLPGRVQVLSLGTGQVLFNEAYCAPAYGHRFSFRDLPAGRYVLLLRTAGTEHRYTLQVQHGAAGAAVTLRTLRARGPRLLLAAQ